jgi:hypothetical protein
LTWSPVLAVARAELRRQWRSLLLLGLLAGLIGATTVSALALSRRTTTAYDRLGARTGVDDARGSVHGHDDLVNEILALPEVADGWAGRIGVAQLEGTFSFLGLTAGPREPSPLMHPVVLAGRMPAAAEGDVIEVALREDFQRAVDVALGTEIPVRFLTEDDYFRFDTGFLGGQPHGPGLTIRVVATIRVAGGISTVPPAFAAPEALRDHPEAFALGDRWFARLVDGSRSFDAFSDGVDALAAGRTLPPEGAEFVVADVYDTGEAAASVDHTADLLGRALLALAGAVALAGLIALIQGFARHHAAGLADRDVEVALGMTRSQRQTAGLVAGTVPALCAVLLTAIAAVLASRIDPIGAITSYEPNPGSSVNVAIVVGGIVATGGIVLLVCLVTGSLTGRRRSLRPPRESSLVERTSRLGGGAAGVTGLRFALEPGRGIRAVPVRSAISGAVIGITGVVAGIVFTSSLDRVVTSPSRSGIPFDAIVADVDAADLEAVLGEPGIGTVVTSASAPLVVDGRNVDGHALTNLRGSLPIDLADGRLPRTPDEITLGIRVARELGKQLGDTVTVVDGQGEEHTLAIVGTGVVPTFNGEQLGLNALITRDGLERVAISEAFTSAVVRAAAGTQPAELIDRLDDSFEADANALPTEVDNLRQLGHLPALVAGLIGTIALVALANALVVLVRRRRGDLALLRTIGFTSRQIAVSVLVMALTIVAIGILVGVPLGLAVGSSVWRLTAEGAFVTTDSLLRWGAIAGVGVAALVVALVAALVPARRASSSTPAGLLRAE